jgi:hypothetical protein
VRRLQKLTKVEGRWKLYKLADLPHRIGESFELEGGDLRYSFKEKSLPGVGSDLAVLAVILVISLEFIDCEEAADTLEKSIRALTFLNPLSRFRTMLKS